VFRRGFTELVFLRRKAHALVRKFRPARMEEFLQFLGDPFESTLRGLLLLSPLYYDYDPAAEDLGNNFREFRVPADLAETKRRLRVVKNILNFLGLFPDINTLFSPEVPVNIPRDELTLGTIVFTAFARFTLSGKTSAAPLHEEELISFFKTAFAKNSDKTNALIPALKEKFYSFLETAMPDGINDIRAFIGLSFRKAEEEFLRLELRRKPDPRYIRSLCFVPA